MTIAVIPSYSSTVKKEVKYANTFGIYYSLKT